MSGFYMRVLASDHVFYQGRVEAVTLPGDDGERTVLAHMQTVSFPSERANFVFAMWKKTGMRRS